MSDLVSKVLAGGLSAALFLFWWPTTVPGSGAEWLLVRGILWALVFEILLLSFCPLERAVTGAIRSRAIRGGLGPREGARIVALAIAGVAVPAALINSTHPERAAARAATRAPAKERVIVKREVVRREVVVRRVNKYVPVTVPAKTMTVAVAPAAASARRAPAPTRPTAPAKPAEPVVQAPEPKPATPPTATPAGAGAPAPATAPAATSPSPSPAAAPAG